jgi:hypothetical protein
MIRMLAQSEVDGAEFSAWLDHSGQGAGYMRTLVDLRPEPMWSAYETTADRLRGEVLGRMFRLLNRWEHSGGTLPDTARRVLERSLSRNPEALFEACMPGPLEGHRRSESVRPLAGKLNDAVRVWSERLDGPQCRPAWAFLGQAAQALPLEETILDKIRTQVRTARISEDPQEGEIALDELTRAGIIAAVHRDQQLGDAIGQRCVLQAEKVESGGAVTAIFHSLLVAAASYSEQEQWRSWAQSKLFDVAIRLPFGQPSRSLSKRLEDLKIVMPAGDDIWSKAEGMALLAT